MLNDFRNKDFRIVKKRAKQYIIYALTVNGCKLQRKCIPFTRTAIKRCIANIKEIRMQ